MQMIETFFGLARLGHTNNKGMAYLLQLALGVFSLLIDCNF
jgi:hypothetical protein